MRQLYYKRMGLTLLLAAGVALALTLLTLGSLAMAAGPDTAKTAATPPVPGRSFIPDPTPGSHSGQTDDEQEDIPTVSVPALPAWVASLIEAGDQASGATDVVVSAMVATGSGDNAIAYNGDTITYTLTITNNTSKPAQNILVLDILPEDTLDQVQCLGPGNCYQVYEVERIPEPLGGTIAVTVTRQISWEVSSLAAYGVAQTSFSGRVAGQADGTVFTNRAFMRYEIDGSVHSTVSNETRTVARARVESGIGAVLSQAPSWLSKDMGGTLSLDWGDFDNDGYMDLALGSTIGTTVYRSNQGRLTRFWSNDRYTLGVRWADLDNNGHLDLIAVGESTGNLATSPGTNYIYRLVGDTFELTTFGSDFQLLRVEPGDFDRDGDLDLIASANAIDAPCPVLLYRNDQGVLSPNVCVSDQATAAIAAGDIDNDDDLDLVLGLFPDRISILVNSSGVLTNAIALNPTGAFLPYDFDWGDYDGDGYLDLATAFPLERRTRIYHNLAGNGFELHRELRSTLFRTPLAVQWGDFNGDGRLDLAVADNPPRVYLNENGAVSSSRTMQLANDSVEGQIWAMAGADHDNDGDPDLAFGNRDGASLLFTTFAPTLQPTLTRIDSGSAGEVSWGDANGDGQLDLLFGAGPNTAGARLYHGKQGAFPTKVLFTASGFGPHLVTFGDANGDRQLDVILGTSGSIQLYSPNQTSQPTWSFPVVAESLAWGDSDDDGDLDLLVGGEEEVFLIPNDGSHLSDAAIWTAEESFDQPRIAWGDYNNDRYQDFAVVGDGQPIRVYRNNQDNTFGLAWSSPISVRGTAVAWADYDGDADQDLTVGTNGEANLLFENVDGVFSTSRLWRSQTTRHTTSLAWGDWDNDGNLDLAVGNDREPAQVYTNQGSEPGSPQLLWLWSSAQSYESASVAWGDYDGDGDLDLALAQSGSAQNGFFINEYVTPAHLTSDFTRFMPLPDNPSYLQIERPGTTPSSYTFATAELLSGPIHPTVTVQYKLYDPNGSRTSGSSDTPGHDISDTIFEYSLDGGGTWHPATPLTASPPISATSRLGQASTFLWDAQADQAISDNARFRMTVIHQNLAGPVQRAATSTISPPFRVRATTCLWPEKPSISISPDHPLPGDLVRLEGSIEQGSGIMTFDWDFGDGTSARGQVVQHVFLSNNQFDVKLTVTSSPCPIAKSVRTTMHMDVGLTAGKIYLPLVRRAQEATGVQSEAAPGASQHIRKDFNWQ